METVSVRSAAGLLALTSIKGIGPATAEKIASRFSDWQELLEAGPEQFKGVASHSIVSQLRQKITIERAIHLAEAELEKADRLGVRVLAVFDDEYPSLLHEISDHPPVIFVMGELPKNRKTVACIGTREPTEFGVKVTNSIVEKLVDAGWGIVSGLALGVDTLAHQAALKFGGYTMAIMAGGLDGIYPKRNEQLADEILSNGGALLSEQRFGVPPAPRNLVQRDRLQSGLSIATFVMQTDIKGGSMHTVRFTLQQDRLLFAPVPLGRHADEPKSQGILALTRLTGKQFALELGVDGDYRKLLSTKFSESPPAFPLHGREDYDQILHRLNERSSRNSIDTQRSLEYQPQLI